MDNLTILAVVLMLVALVPVLAVFGLYPGYLWLVTREHQGFHGKDRDYCPDVCVLIAVHNGEALVNDKLANCLQLDYPEQCLNFIFYSDGSTDNTVSLLAHNASERVQCYASERHIGKAAALNQAMTHTNAEIVIFSDMDAMLNPDAVKLLVTHMADERVGGVCGLRALASNQDGFKQSQQRYIALDSWIKLKESQLGYLTSNDGKLYAIRRCLFSPIAAGVTDDLYNALNIMALGKKFLFEPNAIARIKTPARNPYHEVGRRRRITCRSLNGIFAHKALFNWRRYGGFSAALLINKVLRRLLPVSLLMGLVANGLLLPLHPLFAMTLAAQILLYGLSYGYWRQRFVLGRGGLFKLAGMMFYFILANVGMLLGWIDFLLNKQVIKWEPQKND